MHIPAPFVCGRALARRCRPRRDRVGARGRVGRCGAGRGKVIPAMGPNGANWGRASDRHPNCGPEFGVINTFSSLIRQVGCSAPSVRGRGPRGQGSLQPQESPHPSPLPTLPTLVLQPPLHCKNFRRHFLTNSLRIFATLREKLYGATGFVQLFL